MMSLFAVAVSVTVAAAVASHPVTVASAPQTIADRLWPVKILQSAFLERWTGFSR